MNAGTRLHRRGLQVLRRYSRYLLFVLLGLSVAGVLAASPASAGDRAGIPGIDICPKVAPVSVAPTTGLASTLGERPKHITTDDSPEHIWTTGGFAGFQRGTYDLGCAANPASYLKMATANANNKVSNAFVGISSAAIALADSVDRRAWSPEWIAVFMGDFAERATGTIKYGIILPLLGLGLIASSVFLLIKFRAGNMAGAASAVGWTVLVLFIAAFVLAAPVLGAQTAQRAGATAVTGLNQGNNASDAQTNRIVQEVMYQSWLRRTFGSETSTAAETYGPSLLMSQRITWHELDLIAALDKSDRPEALKKLREKKADDFKEIAQKVKETDSDAYLWLTGEKDAGGLTILEAAYSIVASAFRLMVDLLLITCTIMLVIFGIVWLLASPWIVTPAGQATGVLLLNNTARGMGYVLIAAVASWLFGLYSMIAMQPGQSAWWSLLLLGIGTVIFWTIVRPDRKMLSLMTMGRKSGYGSLTKMLSRLFVAYVGGRIGGATAARRIREDHEEDEPAVESQRSEDHSSPWTGFSPHITYGSVDPDPYVGAQGIPAHTEYVDGEVIDDRVDASRGLPNGAYAQPVGELRGLPAGQPIYQRQDDAVHDAEVISVTPPPVGSVGEVEIYQRSGATHPDDEYVACPWCEGKGCGHCDGGGTVPRWARREMTSGADF